MKVIKYLQDTENNCSPREVYKSSLLLAIDFQIVHKHTLVKFLYFLNLSNAFKA